MDSEKSDSKLRIAWRYNEQQQKTNQSNESIQQHNNYFYLNKFMNPTDIQNDRIHKFTPNNDSKTDIYQSMSIQLNNLIESKFHFTKLKQTKNILRIGKYLLLTVKTIFSGD